jgi:hypothetical protein
MNVINLIWGEKSYPVLGFVQSQLFSNGPFIRVGKVERLLKGPVLRLPVANMPTEMKIGDECALEYENGPRKRADIVDIKKGVQDTAAIFVELLE